MGTAQLVMSGGGTCNVLESDTAYDEKKEDNGAPMDVWRLDFSVRNGSGRWLDHLIARFQIESEWLDCTNRDGPGTGEFQPLEWANSIDFIQESGRNVVGPDERRWCMNRNWPTAGRARPLHGRAALRSAG